MNGHPWNGARRKTKSGVPNPCEKDCPERSSTCHASCKRYKPYQEACMKESEERIIRADAKAASLESVYKNKGMRAKRHYGY